MTTTATNNGSPTNTNGDSNGKTPRPAPSPIEAITKITKILDQLSAGDRKRVLAFINESSE